MCGGVLVSVTLHLQILVLRETVLVLVGKKNSVIENRAGDVGVVCLSLSSGGGGGGVCWMGEWMDEVFLFICFKQGVGIFFAQVASPKGEILDVLTVFSRLFYNKFFGFVVVSAKISW